MNFDFSDDQKMLGEQTRRFLADRCTPQHVRAVLEGDAPYDEQLWAGIVDMGFPGTAWPEEAGGIGAGYLELCVIAEALGRHLAPVPFSSSVYLAAETLLLAGSRDHQQAVLPGIADGNHIATLAMADGPGALTPAAIQTRYSKGKLDGTKIAVPDGSTARYAIVAARSRDGKDAAGIGLYLVDLQGKGVTRSTQTSIDPSRDHARLAFKGAAAEPLNDGKHGWQQLQKVLDRAAVLFAFEQLGLATAAMEMARDYTLERYAFGRPIGSFQALKHRLADVYSLVELARSNCYYGAWALSSDAEELPAAAAVARVSASQAAWEASKENIQLHGGMGFTWAFDCHLYYRRAKLLSLTIGSEQQWKDKLIARVAAA